MKMTVRFNMTPLLLAIYSLSLGMNVQAQSPQAPPSGTSSRPHLSEQEIRGEGIFLQRCSLCHLDKVVKPYKSFGPSLAGVLKGGAPAKERAIRQFISVEVPDKMPGFQYGLSPDDFNDLIAYLKTL